MTVKLWTALFWGYCISTCRAGLLLVKALAPASYTRTPQGESKALVCGVQPLNLIQRAAKPLEQLRSCCEPFFPRTYQ